MLSAMDLRYPIGPWTPVPPSPAARRNHLQDLAGAATQLRQAVRGLSDAQLDTAYRPGGWTLRQVVHHLPDSHVNGYIRMRFALTEDAPKIMPFDEARWAELEDARRGVLEPSLKMVDAVHLRWAMLLRGLTEDDWTRVYVHPDHGRMTIEKALDLYAWHTRHHLAHLTSMRERSNWK
jgi:hypothetical protein